MAEFAKQISDLLLYKELDRAAGRDGIDRTEVDRLKGLVNDVTEIVGPVMAQIPVTFRQYTVHDIRHCRNVIDRMGDILPEETRGKLNALEIAFLLLSALLHDIGMVVSDREKAETQRSDSFRRFREEGHSDRSKAIEDARAASNEPRARAIEDALLAEYYRRLHPERVRQFMDNYLSGELRYQEVDFSDDLARLCESHAWGVEESNDGRHPKNAVARLDDNVRLYGVRINLQYLACILRLADILDFDRSRTPLAVFQYLDFTEPKSWEEWNKHLQVKGWEITPTQVAFEIPCTQPVFYVAVHEFLSWIDEELRQCRYLVENKPQATAERYKLLVPQVVDRHKVRMADPSYVAGAFRFQLEYENILQLLMDKSLYPDPSLFLRELLQNALDACRRKEAEMEIAGLKRFYKPRIVVWDRTTDPQDPHIVFQDNGIGMSQRIVEQYFLRVGRSYYRSPEFDAERQRLRETGKELDACSQFGIGILSCFLVGDWFEVVTYQEGYEPLRVLVEGPTKYFLIQRLQKPESGIYDRGASDEENGPPTHSGTKVIVHLRSRESLKAGAVLKTFGVNLDYPVAVYEGNQHRSKALGRLNWEKSVRLRDFRFFDGGRTDPGIRRLLAFDFDFDRRQKSVSGLVGLEEVIKESLIPFAQWSFSSHIRGSAWFWLLKMDNGDLTPRLGNLKVGLNLSIIGLPAFVAELERHSLRTASYVALLEEIVERADESSFWEPDGSSEIDGLSKMWLDYSENEQDEIREAVARRERTLSSIKGRLSWWASNAKVMKSLAHGSLAWADEPVHFGLGSLGAFLEDERLALHSILIPAGIVQWSPARGVAEPKPLLTMFGGSKIDVHTSKAPRPAAHRLFVLTEQADELRQQYLRAALRSGSDLVCSYGEGASWREWFEGLWEVALGRGLELEEAIKSDGAYILERCSLAFMLGGERVYMKFSEAAKFDDGPVPIHSFQGKYDSLALLPYEYLNRFFIPQFNIASSLMEPMLSLSDNRNPGLAVDISKFPFRLLKQTKGKRATRRS